MEYALSKDGGVTYGSYKSDVSPDLSGSVLIKLRLKAQGATPASGDVILVFTLDCGDVNGDEIIDISDVIMAAEIAVGGTSYTSEQVTRANVTDEAKEIVDISDVVLIAERAVGKNEVFPIELR